MSIRRCGHSKDHFFIELGRSAVTGAGEIYMATEGTLIAQNMHETVLSAMKSSKIREDGTLLPRPRSASTSENSNPAATRRPVGVVAPQTLTSSNSYVLSGSRERCDSLPTRPKTLVENSQNGIVLSFSPCSMSSATGNTSSTEDMDSIKVHSSGSHFNSKSADGITPSDLPITEVPDEYLMMSPSDTKQAKQCVKIEKETCNATTPVILSIPKQASVSNNPTYMSMAQTSISENKTVVQENYVTMSAVNISPKTTFNDMNSSNKSNAECFHENNAFISSKVSSVGGETVSSSSQILNAHFQSETKTCDKPPVSDKLTNFCFASNLGNVQFHSRNKTNKVPEFEGNAPAVPPHQNDPDLKSEAKKFAFESCVKENVKCIQIEENCESEENTNFNYSKKSTEISPVDQNTNFNCQVNSERCSKNLLPCAYSCSETEKSHTCDAASYILLEPKHDGKRKQKNIHGRILGKESASPNSHELIQYHLSNTFPGSKNFNFPAKSENAITHSQDDYVNLEFKSSSGSNLCLSAQTHNLQQIPPSHCAADPSYSNLHLGKPFCPVPNPALAKLETTVLPYGSSIRAEKTAKSEQNPSSSMNVNSFPDGNRSQKLHKSPTSTLSKDVPKTLTLMPKFRNIPNTLPAFRKQMSAPAAPPSLRPELPSPGRKSSCPVTASASMIKPPHPTTVVSCMKPSLGVLSSHLKVSSSRSPDHSSVSSISSASDEISSNHSSPKTNVAQNFRQHFPDSQYENVVLPSKLPSHKIVPSVDDEKELNYASLDLAPATKDEIPSSPTFQKPAESNYEEPLLYAEIDFTKSEGLKNTSGTFRDSRL
ncbi:insulin receptor substrate 1-A-like [Uloborus diversus]|uniref:insulin receptor substrate 1-A-like n=1 Tax=Uloborus diversus TaxID=327109 RepID=UPI002409668F|nr:insulin receptor substrate 1-A-like [Uloborus diversus]